MRLIDADELLERLRNAEAFYRHETAGDFDTGRALGLNEARQKVAEQPTIEAEPDDGWISVKDRLPPYGERILVVNEAYEAKLGYTRYNCGITVRDPHLNFTFWGHKVTHWQPLPEPPKGE